MAILDDGIGDVADGEPAMQEREADGDVLAAAQLLVEPADGIERATPHGHVGRHDVGHALEPRQLARCRRRTPRALTRRHQLSLVEVSAGGVEAVESSQQTAQPIALDDVVGITERQPIGTGLGDADVAGMRRAPAIAGFDDDEPVVTESGNGGVERVALRRRRAVQRQQDFERLVDVLRGDGAQLHLDEIVDRADRDDHAGRWCSRHRRGSSLLNSGWQLASRLLADDDIGHGRRASVGATALMPRRPPLVGYAAATGAVVSALRKRLCS